MSEANEPTITVEDDNLGPPAPPVEEIEIEVILQDGFPTQVFYRGERSRAVVRDYDVAYPCAATHLQHDDEGNPYFEYIV